MLHAVLFNRSDKLCDTQQHMHFLYFLNAQHLEGVRWFIDLVLSIFSQPYHILCWCHSYLARMKKDESNKMPNIFDTLPSKFRFEAMKVEVVIPARTFNCFKLHSGNVWKICIKLRLLAHFVQCNCFHSGCKKQVSSWYAGNVLSMLLSACCLHFFHV